MNPATYQYEYAVVTDANKASLYIYARNVAKFQETYQKEVLKFCEDYGFNSYYNEPRKTPQPASCWYNRADANKTIPVELPLKAKEEDNFHHIAEALESFRGHRFCPRKADWINTFQFSIVLDIEIVIWFVMWIKWLVSKWNGSRYPRMDQVKFVEGSL